MLKIKKPETAEEFQLYYDLRYRILRKPWKQPRGSEKDELEDVSFHVMAVEDRRVIGVGRLHNNSRKESQIRFMAVEQGFERRGTGTRLLRELENEAKRRGSEYIILNSRENACNFYAKHGYRVVGPAPALFGEIPHFRMKKDL